MPDNENNRSPLDPKLGTILELLRDIPIVDAVPTDPPKFPIGFAFYENAGTRRFYIFFSGAWYYATLT